MKSRVVQLGLAVAAGLSALGVLGVVLQWWWLVALAGFGMGSAILLLLTDLIRRSRATYRVLNGGTAVDTTPDVEELVGVVRVLQAQYVGRMDQLQRQVDDLGSATSPR